MGDIAVVGIDCAFPGAAGVQAYWDLLMRGGAGTGPVPAQRWEAQDFPAVSGRGGFIDDVDVFDSDFFSVTPREAAAMDPHQRLLLPCAWRALEDSGRAPGELAGTETGVFIGMMGGEWGRLTMSDLAQVTPLLGAGSSAGMAANRISYHFNLTGPSLAVDTACSSSLVAVHLAANSLLAGECDTALAGGANIVLSPSMGMVYGQLGLAAHDGRCKPFSADADGIGRSDGVGLVVLRRLDDALAEGQRIYAVLRGSAVNQDGRSNGVIAPNRWSQQRVLNSAYRRAGITPDRVAFLEAHGTGTVLGDAIECAALGALHGIARDAPCALGSVKGNLGHTEGAAGIAGLIKTALALHHRMVPASPFAERENPRLRLGERGLRLLKSPMRLPRGESLAGVSSFGMGGTNAHAVLGSAPRLPRRTAAAMPKARTGAARGAVGVFTVSGDTPEGLRRNLAAQAEAVARRPRGGAAALCWSSNRIKTGLPHRFAVTVRDTDELVSALRGAAAQDPAGLGGRPWGRPVVAFLFTGQGSEFPGMTARLHRESAAYRRHLDEADEALAAPLGTSVRDLILGGDDRVHRPEFAQPALFAVGYALARTLTALGIVPAAVLGHSLGEYAAAVTAGTLELDEAARLVVRRGALTGELPPGGGMLAVATAPEELAGILAGEPDAVVAALNGPADTVLSGPSAALARIGKELTGRGVRVRELPAPYAFHSPLMAPAAAKLRTEAVRCAQPAVPVASTRHGRMLHHEPMDADYWADQIEEPVLMDTALRALVSDIAPTHLIEIGPRTQLLQLAARGGRAPGAEFLHPAPGPEATGRDLAETVAALHRCGLDPVWEELYAPEHRVVEQMSPYVFSSAQRYWDRRAPLRAATAPAQAPAGERLPERQDPQAAPAPAPASAPARDAGDPVLLAVVQAVTEVGGYPPERVVREARFHEDLGFDSVMIMQLKNRVEARLPRVGEVSVQQMLPALRSVGSLAEFLGGLITARSA
ncbi:type I polyketide synthase [Streptomyces sp. NBC_00162]|uniref:type I polyketide synthase n=1 Tax=Streptomyces sp. NBC_00162 TaxID=2903629 RepID=UPI00214C05A7|nr:type I polyketide synthase [Streptomyces sp. NBC_00162]UUU39279.1 acyltransferase domain-containing protein [Streptomyces sp. NBC_00162]